MPKFSAATASDTDKWADRLHHVGVVMSVETKSKHNLGKLQL